MGLKPDAIDEIGGTSRPLVEIPSPPSDRGEFVVFGVLWAGMVPMTVGLFLYIVYIDSGSIEPLFRWPFTLILCIMLLVSFVRVRSCLTWASRPQFQFVIGKDGLRLRVGQDDRGLHYECYEWKEVNYCHWSHFEPGVLNIQVGANPARSRVSWPPTRLFYGVPEAYRSRVEEAIRAMGKWRDSEASPVKHAPITVTAVKVAIPLRPHQIPRDLVPPEPAPAGTPVLSLQLEGTNTTVTAQLNGKSCRKLLKQIAEYGSDNTNIILQGNLKPGLTPGSFTLESAGFQAFNKAPTQPTGPS